MEVPITKTLFGSFIAVVLLICFTSICRADFPPSEVQEINKFRLAEKNLAQFKQATKNLLAAAEQNQDLFDKQEEIQSETIAAYVEATDKIAPAKKAIQDAAMTTRDYWLFEFASIYAASGQLMMKAGQKLPEGYSKENVDFYAAHQAEFGKLQSDMKKLTEIFKASDDDSDDDSDDEQE
jgi:hypothetical protein